jgi:glucose/arabinose dehydrogenase
MLQEVLMMKIFIRSLLLVTSVLICLALLGCSTVAIPEETEEVAPEKTEDQDLVEDEEKTEEEETAEETTQTNKQSTTSGSGFKHEVQMKIDGVVETDQNEGWWDLN